MPEKQPISCPLCGESAYTVVYKAKKKVSDPALLYGAASGVKGTQQLVRCKGCGLLYENPRFDEATILAGYSASKEEGHDSQFALRAESFLRTLRLLSETLPPKGARVLDIGSAGGAFLEAAKRFGYEAEGLEPSKDLVEHARKRGLNVSEGTIAAHPFEQASFDLICFWDVLEHLVDPLAAVREAGKLLKPNGLLLINYPAIDTTMARLAGERFWWILSGHLLHFSQKAVRQTCEKAGLEAFLFKPYWQELELGYLFKIADQLGVPLAGKIGRFLPTRLAHLPIRYYASQTTALARKPAVQTKESA